MLGNDIVDLADAETRRGSQHPRFDQRVFTPSERATLAESTDPARTRWILWSVKEGAYKALRQVRPETVFSPVAFAVQLDSQLRGFVTYQGHRYRAKVETAGSCVHAIVSTDPISSGVPTTGPRGLLWGSKRIIVSSPEQPGQQVRALALGQIAARLGIVRPDLRIESVDRIPRLVHRGEYTMLPLSLSHHGSYVGFACRITGWSADGIEGTTH